MTDATEKVVALPVPAIRWPLDNPLCPPGDYYTANQVRECVQSAYAELAAERDEHKKAAQVIGEMNAELVQRAVAAESQVTALSAQLAELQAKVDHEKWLRVNAENFTAAQGDLLHAELAELRGIADRLRDALQFYADKGHFNLADEDAWDTVSGEPPNFWCDEAGTATIEDGGIARFTLAAADGAATGETE